MKSITAFAVLVIIMIFPRPLSAQEKLNESYAFSLNPVFGLIYGQAEEIVYPDERKYKAELLSQLLWDIKPVFYYGLALDFSRIEPLEKWGFFSNLSLKYGISGMSGKMEDRDWQSIENDALTNFSKHDNLTKELFMMGFTAGFSFPLPQGFLLKALADVSYKRFCFSGSGGYLEYARQIGDGIYAPIADNPDITKYPDGEKVINYTQDWLVFAPGISLAFYVIRQFFAELSFQISPLVLCADLDEHLGRNLQFRDYTRGGLYLEPGLRLSYIAGKRMEISLAGSWQKILGARGPTYSRRIGQGDYKIGGEAGTGLSLMDLSLNVKVRM
jgi:outer membrane protease